jgi:hypothetical protein
MNFFVAVAIPLDPIAYRGKSAISYGECVPVMPNVTARRTSSLADLIFDRWPTRR